MNAYSNTFSPTTQYIKFLSQVYNSDYYAIIQLTN